MSRYARHKDRNHSQVVDWFHQLGASVETLESPRAGVPDLLVGYLGVDQLVEVKPLVGETRKRELRASQVDWHASWRGRKPVVVRTLADVTKVLASIRGDLTCAEVAS